MYCKGVVILISKIVVVPKHILRAAKMEAKRFPYTFLVSCEFPAGVRVVVVDGFTTALKITFVTR